MKNQDSVKHVKGESIFINDFTLPAGTLTSLVFVSDISHGRIKKLDLAESINTHGIQAILTYKDIPGENQIGGIIPDETLLAEDTVEFAGEPIALLIGDNPDILRIAKEKIKVSYEHLPAVYDPRKAFEGGNLIAPTRIFESGDIQKAWDKCDFIFEGRVESGGQEHLYLETQGSIAIPTEGIGLKVISSTQSPTTVQRSISRVLGIPMNKIEVDVLRLGGGFGGKEDQATAWACLAALGAIKTNRPVKLVLSRGEDLRMTGKRHPYSSDYKIGLTKDGKILAYEVTYFQNSGAFADLSTAILDRTLFHATNSYFIPNVKATGHACKTNLPPNTAFRGFGGPQAMFVIEAAIFKAAEKMGINAKDIQKINLLKSNDVFHYGQTASYCKAEECWNSLQKRFDFQLINKDIKKFNNQNRYYKKGIAFMPVCFGISFTNTFLNQASALVHIYTDGSIGISTAAVEMGQGVNEKLRIIASRIFSIGLEKIKIETTNTTRIANTSATAASSASDLNGNALITACETILGRLNRTAADYLGVADPRGILFKNGQVYHKNKRTDLTWPKLIGIAYRSRINLSSHAFYATPDLHFDIKKVKGKPFAYHVYGSAAIISKVDCLRGIIEIESVKVVHDIGKSLNELVDKGQAEGAITQGIGWLTLEEIAYSDSGQLLSNSLSTYKVPDIFQTAAEIDVHFLENSENPIGPFNSKAIGEPPFMYGIGAYFATLNAMKAFKPQVDVKIDAPLTNEKVLLALYSKIEEEVP